MTIVSLEVSILMSEPEILSIKRSFYTEHDEVTHYF